MMIQGQKYSTKLFDGEYPVSHLGSYGAWRGYKHNGIDFAMPIGTKIKAISRGVVATYDNKNGGICIYFYDLNLYAWYFHMNCFYDVGDEIEEGEYIGESGNKGMSTGPHLHIQIGPEIGQPYLEFNKTIDPEPYILIDDEVNILTPHTNEVLRKAPFINANLEILKQHKPDVYNKYGKDRLFIFWIYDGGQAEYLYNISKWAPELLDYYKSKSWDAEVITYHYSDSVSKKYGNIWDKKKRIGS